MTPILATVFRGAARYVLWFVVIVAILTIAEIFRQEITEFKDATLQLARLKDARAELDSFVDKAAVAAIERLKVAENDTDASFENRVRGLNDEIKKLEADGPVRAEDILKGRGVEKAKGQLRLELLRKERAYVNDLRQYGRAVLNTKGAKEQLELLRAASQKAKDLLMANIRDQEELRRVHPWKSRIWRTDAYRKRQQLEADQAVIAREKDTAQADYEQQALVIERINVPKPALPQLDRSPILDELGTFADSLEQRLKKNWLSVLSRSTAPVLPVAAAILAMLILVPIILKVFLYYLIAPIASNRPPICLLPDADGTVTLAGGNSEKPPSAVSQPVEVGPGEELLVHAEYLQSTADLGAKDTKWFLDSSLPLSSLASGMVALTRIRADTRLSFVVSATKDPLSEISLITLPEHGAIILQPRSLVGVLQSIDRPVRISRHWRLGSLGAWLTLQLRYLVFHGPATLIVKGCRGVRMEPATVGRSINQAATMGFSANVNYSVRRYETFWPYLSGKQDLFNDNFAGGSGYCIYEEIPDARRKAGITGRGIEGVFDSLLKVFGI